MGGDSYPTTNTGNDTLDGGSGEDIMNGEDGDDTYIVDNPFDSVIEEINGGFDRINSSIDYGLNVTLEDLTLTGTSAVNGAGNDLDNTIIGNTADNTMDGLTGNDVLYGEGGNDVLWGSSGNDYLNGGDGSDFLSGDGDDDTLDGGLGIDIMYGGTGNNLYIVDNSNDAVDDSGSGGAIDLVHSSVSFTLLATFLDNLLLTDISAIDGTGNKLNNSIIGNDANNTIMGNGGNDDLKGGNGNDIIKGGSDLLTSNTGNDTLGGGTGSDTMSGQDGDDLYLVENSLDSVIEEVNGGIDSVNSAITYKLGANVEQLNLLGNTVINGTGNAFSNTLTGNGASNSLTGDAGNDTLLGRGGIDTLIGGIGDDSLTGGNGADRITGGTGKDRFVFTTKTEGKDTITDFSVVDDTIDVSKFGFGGGLTANAAITAAQFRVGTRAGDASDRFIYNKTSGALLFDTDGTGASAFTQFAQFSTGLALTNNDIFVLA